MQKREWFFLAYLFQMDKKLLHGAHTALVTPMKDGQVSYTCLQSVLSKQLASDISGVVPCGTTGESPTLSDQEHLQVIKSTIEVVNGKIPVIAGTGANSTQEALELTKKRMMLVQMHFFQLHHIITNQVRKGSWHISVP